MTCRFYYSMRMETGILIFILLPVVMKMNTIDPAYQDQLYINDGKGNFKLDSSCTSKKFYQ